MLNEGNQIHNTLSVRTFLIPFYYGSGSDSGSGTVINYSSGSDFLARYGSGSSSGSASQKLTVPTVPVPVPQRCFLYNCSFPARNLVDQDQRSKTKNAKSTGEWWWRQSGPWGQLWPASCWRCEPEAFLRVAHSYETNFPLFPFRIRIPLRILLFCQWPSRWQQKIIIFF